MGVVLHAERLAARADGLAGGGVNGMKLAYLTLDGATPPAFAQLEVEFLNTVGLGAAVAADFVVEGGVRRTGVAVTAVAGAGARRLRLMLAPVGDYSTYTLRVRGGALAPLTDPLFAALPFKFRPGCFNLNCAPDDEPAPDDSPLPAIDYLARDYDSFRHVLMSAMAARVPGWQPTSEADLDQVLIDLIAAHADELADAHDRVMAERSIATARRRVSLARHARLVDYHIHQGNQATTVLAARVGARADLPAIGGNDFLAFDTPTAGERGAIVFTLPRDRVRWRRRIFPQLNDLWLYTWDDSVSALAAGATSADLTLAGDTTHAAALRLRDFLRGTHALQAGAPADVDAAVPRLLIEEILNPASGEPNGRSRTRRQVLRLVPGAAEVVEDPVPVGGGSRWCCRVRWVEDDRLRQNFCFVSDCPGGIVRNLTLFHGNLLDVAHGRPRQWTFVPAGDPLLANQSAWRRLSARDGSAGGALAELPQDPLVGPVAYRDTAPGGDEIPRTTARVQVSGRAWEERIDLVGSEGDDRHFMVETDERGWSRLRFGDGVNGAPVPDGAVIDCRFESGGGVAGNVGADTLTQCTYPDVRIWNPLDVWNGRDPEGREEIVRRAPEAFRRHQRRAVTLGDYRREAEAVPGVSRAGARHAWCGSWRAVRVAIDPAAGRAYDELLPAVSRALDAVRLIGDDVEIREADYVPLDIRLDVCAHPDHWTENLRGELEREFSAGYTRDGRRGLFHRDEWTFGQSLHASQLIGRALAVPGVERVVRVSMRRFDPGSGGGLVTVVVDPAAMPHPAAARLAIGPFEVLVVDNDPDHLEHGRIGFGIRGGRR